MRVSSAFILLAVIAVAWAIPAPKVTKESSIDDVEIEKKDLKIGEEIGDDKERAKKSATFCVEVRSGSQHAKAVPCGCAQTPCGCNKENHEEMHQTPCGCHKHQPHKVHQTVHTVHIVQQNEESKEQSKEQSKEESKEEPCEEVTTPAPVVLESTILPETTTPEVVVTETTTVPPTTVPPTTVPPTTVPPTTTTAEVEIVTEPPKSEKMVEQPCKDHMVVVQMQPPRCQHHAVITECDCKPPSMPVPVMPMPMMEGMYPMVKDHPMHHLFKERMHMMPGMAHMMPGVAHKIEKWTKV